MKVTQEIPEYQIIAPKEAIIRWKHDEITRQMVEILKNDRILRLSEIGDGITIGDRTAEATNRAVGYLEGIGFVLELFELKFVVEDDDDRAGKEDDETNS